ncbi:hypothetical protein KCU72_g13, partial [Aureobasidium melanogenum]
LFFVLILSVHSLIILIALLIDLVFASNQLTTSKSFRKSAEVVDATNTTHSNRYHGPGAITAPASPPSWKCLFILASTMRRLSYKYSSLRVSRPRLNITLFHLSSVSDVFIGNITTGGMKGTHTLVPSPSSTLPFATTVTSSLSFSLATGIGLILTICARCIVVSIALKARIPAFEGLKGDSKLGARAWVVEVRRGRSKRQLVVIVVESWSLAWSSLRPSGGINLAKCLNPTQFSPRPASSFCKHRHA